MKHKNPTIQFMLMVVAVLLLILPGTARAQAVYGEGEDGGVVDIPPDSAIEATGSLIVIQGVDTVDNGDFELGNLSSWGIYSAGSTSGPFVYSGTVSPQSDHAIPLPPQGAWAATTDQLGSNVQILYQDITLNGRYELNFMLYSMNWAGAYYSPLSLDYTGGPNQQFRVDIMNPAAALLSVNPADVYLNIFQTNPGDPMLFPWAPYSADLGPWAGQTVRLRFAEVDNSLWYNGAVDDIRLNLVGSAVDIKPGSCPNPINVKSKGVLPVAILGNAPDDVTEIDVSTILLEGVSPLRWDMKDVATPFEPYIGREDAMDCTTSGPDGFMDLTLKFDTQEIVAALGDVSDGQVVVMQLTGNLLDGTPIIGEDVVVIISKAIAEGTLPLGDDDYEEVPLGFTFPYQGQEWTSVFVNSNGNLTFGAGDSWWIESVGGFLGGPPRIAALWDDLDPGAGGEVTVLSEKNNSLTISFTDVPEWLAGGANNFSITLRSGGQVDITYGAVSASDGLVGLTEGAGAANPGETDLSEAKTLPAYGTTYEQFGGDFDLDDTDLRFRG